MIEARIGDIWKLTGIRTTSYEIVGEVSSEEQRGFESWKMRNMTTGSEHPYPKEFLVHEGEIDKGWEFVSRPKPEVEIEEVIEI